MSGFIHFITGRKNTSVTLLIGLFFAILAFGPLRAARNTEVTEEITSRGEFEIPKAYGFLYGIAIGYPSDAAINEFGAHRLDIDEIVIR
ncbi:MAG: hypothetical protein RLZ41_934 [Actinomycetota bacterium]|jgi:hypothetical protein